jgi:hypothetical protein
MMAEGRAMDWTFLRIGNVATVAAAAPTETFWQKIVIAAVGPGISVLLGSLAVGLFVTWFTDRARQRQAVDAKRERFVVKMSTIASTFYIESVHFLRDKADGLVTQEDRTKLDESYRTFRVAADALEEQLRVCFGDDGPRALWHAATDLLTVRYYAAIDRLNEALIDGNAGNAHSMLEASDLGDRIKVREAYKKRLKLAMRAVEDAQLRGD